MYPNLKTTPDAPGGAYGGHTSAAITTDQRLKMRALGYNPIPVLGKAPMIGGWDKLFDTTDHQIRSWERARPAETNTGILTRYHPAFDIDVLSRAAVADDVFSLIESELAAMGGRVMVRFGLKPNRAVLCRTTEPFKKIKVTLESFFTDPDTGEIKYDAIEVLGDGQQVVCLGIHPDTGRPYEWVGGAPTYVKASDLPLITEADARAIVDKIVVMLGERHVINVRTPAKATRPDTPAADAKKTDVATRYGAKALARASEAIANAKGGSQEETLNDECYGIGQLVGGGELPAAKALSELRAAAAKIPNFDPKNPWTTAEVAKKVNRSFADGKANPRAARKTTRNKVVGRLKNGRTRSLFLTRYRPLLSSILSSCPSVFSRGFETHPIGCSAPSTLWAFPSSICSDL